MGWPLEGKGPKGEEGEEEGPYIKVPSAVPKPLSM